MIFLLNILGTFWQLGSFLMNVVVKLLLHTHDDRKVSLLLRTQCFFIKWRIHGTISPENISFDTTNSGKSE